MANDKDFSGIGKINIGSIELKTSTNASGSPSFSTINLYKHFPLKTLIIKESIFQQLLSGSITVEDKNFYFKQFPIIGGEILKIQLKIDITQDIRDTLNLQFYVTRGYLLAQDEDNKGVYLYHLEFTEPCIIDYLKERSISYSDGLLTDFVKSMSKLLLNKEIADINIEKSADKIKSTPVTVPYYDFPSALKYLNLFMKSKDGAFDYLYFSCLGNSDTPIITQYKTLSNIIKKPWDSIKANFSYLSKETKKLYFEYAEVDGSELHNPQGFKNHTIGGTFDLAEAQRRQGLGATNLSWDWTIKDVVPKEIRVDEILTALTHTGNTFLFDKTFHNNNKYNINFKYGDDLESYRAEVDMVRNNYDQSFSFSTTFQTGIWLRKLGSMCSVKFKNYSTGDSKGLPCYNGNYLVSEIMHMIGPENYAQTIKFMTTAMPVKVNSNQIDFSNVFKK